MTTEQIVLASRPKGMPTTENFRSQEVAVNEIKDGEILLKGLYYSVDPYMRGRMNDAKSYAPPFEIDKPIMGSVIGKVVESKSDKFKKDEVVVGMLPWQKDFIATEKELTKIDTDLAPASYYLSILGMTGLTAYFGLMHIGKPKAGETVVVSGAAGAVGIVVGQIAKIQGCRVVGIAGTDEKIAMLKNEFGFDEAINYKTTTDISKAIAGACPDGVDVYFDNVGGEISDAVIKNINMGPRLQPMLLTRSVLMQGFIVSNFQPDFPEGIKKLGQWVKEGKLKFTETIEDGFENLPTALLGLFKGENTGKMVVKA